MSRNVSSHGNGFRIAPSYRIVHFGRGLRRWWWPYVAINVKLLIFRYKWMFLEYLMELIIIIIKVLEVVVFVVLITYVYLISMYWVKNKFNFVLTDRHRSAIKHYYFRTLQPPGTAIPVPMTLFCSTPPLPSSSQWTAAEL